MVNSLVAFLVSGFGSKPKSQYIDTVVLPLPRDDDEGQRLPAQPIRGNKSRTASAPIEAVTTKFDRPPRPAASVSLPLSAYQDLNSFFAPCPPRPDEFKCPPVVYRKYPPKAPKVNNKASPSLAASAPASASPLNQTASPKRTLRHTFSRLSLATAARYPPRKNSAPAALGLSKSTSSYNLREDALEQSAASSRPAREPHYKLRRLQSVDELRSYTFPSPSASPIKNAHPIDYTPNNARYQELVSFVSYIEQSATFEAGSKTAPPQIPVSPVLSSTTGTPRFTGARSQALSLANAPAISKNAKKHIIRSLKYGSKRPTISYPILVEQNMVFPRSRQASVQRASRDQHAGSGSSSESEMSDADATINDFGQFPCHSSTPPLRIRSTRTRLERSNAYARLEARQPLAGRQRLVSAFDSDSSEASDSEGIDSNEEAKEDEDDLASVIGLFPSPNPSRDVSPASTLLSLASSDSSSSETLSSGASSPALSSAPATPLEMHNMHQFDLIFPHEGPMKEKRDWQPDNADFNRALLHIDTRRANNVSGCQDDASTVHAADDNAITPTPASTLAYLQRQKARRSERPDSNTDKDGACFSVTYSVVQYYTEVMKQERIQRYSCCSSSYQGGSSIGSSSWDSDADDEDVKRRDPFYLEDDEFQHFMNL